MFAAGTYQPTYSGPITASGESFRRPRNEGMALAGTLGHSRQYRPQSGGIAAGSKMRAYQAGLQADRAAQDGIMQSRDSVLRGLGDAADARFAYQSSIADERAGILGQLLDKEKVDTRERIARRGEQYDETAFKRRMDAERYAADKQQEARFWSTILGIL